MIVFIRSSLIERDVRAKKYLDYLDKKNVILIQWDRTNENTISDSNCYTHSRQGEFGKGLKSLFKFILWNLFIFKILVKRGRDFSVIQVCDLDSYFPTFFFRILGKKVIFDVYDFFADSKISKRNSPFYSILYNLEMFCLKYVDLIILPLLSRKDHLNFIPDKWLICENVPQVYSDIKDYEINLNFNFINVVYAGTLESNHRGLEWIPQLAGNLKHKVRFYVAGSGSLKSFFEQAAQDHDNIFYLGTISHSESLSLQKKADLIYAIYRTTLVNNVLAAPNKFYESIYLGTPVIINSGVSISELINKKKIGFKIEESISAIEEFLTTIDKNTISICSERAQDYWIQNYQNYIEKKYKQEYGIYLTRLINQ